VIVDEMEVLWHNYNRNMVANNTSKVKALLCLLRLFLIFFAVLKYKLG